MCSIIYFNRKINYQILEEEEILEDVDSPKSLYRRMCRNLKVIPCRYFMAHLDNNKLVLRNHQFSKEEIRAMSKPLWVLI